MTLLLSAVLASGGATCVRAAAIVSPFIVTIPETDPSQAMQEAMRLELVRLTGTREAATDPTLAALVDGARQYVQLERTTTSGQIQVLFDAAALPAAIQAAGRSIWDLDRPLLWISLPPEDAATDRIMRARLAASAQERGLPIVIAAPGPAPGQPSPPQSPQSPQPQQSQLTQPTAPPAAAPPPSPGAVASASPAVTSPLAAQAPSATQLLEAAHRAGANAALVARPLPSSPGTLQWTLAAPTTAGQWSGGPELAIENATEALASAARTTDQAPLADFDCQIEGVNDLASFVNVLAAMQAAPGISEYTVEDIEGPQLTLHLKARANLQQLQRMLVGDRLQANGTGAGGVLEYRYVPGP